MRNKASFQLPDFKVFDGLGVDGLNLIRFMFAQIPFDFLFPMSVDCPTDYIRFLLYLSRNAFCTMIEIDNCMRSIRSSLTCQTPSDSI